MSNRDRRQEINAGFRSPEVLGTIDPNSPLLDAKPQGTTTSWTNPDGHTITLVEPPPPWEVDDGHGYAMSDARKFVDVPPNWKLRWVNPRLLDSEGWRDWQALNATDPRITVKVPTMVTPENYVRRGGPNGDILCWMWAGWYESKIRIQREATKAQTQLAVDTQENLREEFKRGTYGPNVSLTDAKHPTHTQVDGKSIKEDN